MLRLDDLMVTVPPGSARWRVSLAVRTGELVAVDAHPAAGTALARTLVGLAPPAGGSIWQGDREVTAAAPVQRHIGYVPHGGGLLPHLTVRENIEYGLRRREMVRDVARAWVQTVIEQLELGPTLHLRPHLISDAQRLRAAVARAVACLPEVLVLDLPYGSPVRLRDILAHTGSSATGPAGSPATAPTAGALAPGGPVPGPPVTGHAAGSSTAPLTAGSRAAAPSTGSSAPVSAAGWAMSSSADGPGAGSPAAGSGPFALATSGQERAFSPGLSVLVCSADQSVRDQADRVVALEPVGTAA